MLLSSFFVVFLSTFYSLAPYAHPTAVSPASSDQVADTASASQRADTDVPSVSPFVKTLFIPMRDGVALPADLYLPHPDATGLPCILARTPYGRSLHKKEYAQLALDGYAVVVQDLRSSLDSEGKTFPYFTDAWGGLQDGYDTIEWLAKESFTNGKIATTGVSARGLAQNMLAPTAPPHLVYQHIGFAPSSLHEALYQGGVLQKNLVEGWFARYANNPAIFKFIECHASAHTFWCQYDSVAAASHIESPALHYGGWYDLFLQGTLKSFTSRQNHGGPKARGKQTLVVGPWTHHWNDGKDKGPTIWPEQANHPPIDISLSKWMKTHLKDEQSPTLPAVTYYVMGPLNEPEASKPGHIWKQADSWPIPAERQNWKLKPKGLLTKEKVAEEQIAQQTTETKEVGERKNEESIEFVFSPNDPVPTIGGRNLFLPSGPLDQREIETRDDVLLFTSEPLTENTEVTGPLEAFLFCTSDAPVMDVAVRLTDVYPDGRSLLISEGLTRVQMRENEQSTAQKTQEAYEVHVDLWATSQLFAKGHRIRISLSASHFPKYDLPPDKNVAHHRLFYGPNTPSRIILPVVAPSP